jgi:hypothetical protein
MTKIDGRTGKAAVKQLDESLRRLQTDAIDLLQFHEVIRLSDPERIFAPNGAFQAMLDAKKAGKIRYLGFTGHKSPEIHLKMLETCFAHSFTPATVQMPLNLMDAHYDSFQKQVLPVLLKHGIGPHDDGDGPCIYRPSTGPHIVNHGQPRARQGRSLPEKSGYAGVEVSRWISLGPCLIWKRPSTVSQIQPE